MKNQYHTLIFTACLAIFASLGSFQCGSATSPSAESSSEVTYGKADSEWSYCTKNHVLLRLNDPGISKEELKNRGLHTRAAKNIIKYRTGKDEELGTDDDKYFQTLRSIDDVHYVGPAAIEQLRTNSQSFCKDWKRNKPETIFSPKSYEASHLARIKELIREAEDSIDIGIYSFNDETVVDELISAANRGVSIRLLSDEAHGVDGDPGDSIFGKLERNGVDVRYVNKTMHQKFLIVDGPREDLTESLSTTLGNSSGNWTRSAATKFDENMVVIHNSVELGLEMQKEFNEMWNFSRDFRFGKTKYKKSVSIPEEAIPDTGAQEAVFTSSNFRKYVSDRWGKTFTHRDNQQNVSDKLIDLIKKADESIWVAQGHMRYRPIAEALIEKQQSDPNVEIKVYLDNQEFIDKEGHEELQVELEECLQKAGGDKGDKKDCRRGGFYFSYALAQQDIDIRFKYYAYYWHYFYAPQMHHKYMIFDKDTVASGSYNISQTAEIDTFENVFIYRAAGYPELVENFIDNFQQIWQTGRENEGFESLKEKIRESDDRAPIRFDPIALSWSEVSELRALLRKKCSTLDTEKYKKGRTEYSSCEVR